MTEVDADPTDSEQTGLVSGVDLSRRAAGGDPSSGGVELPDDAIEAASDQALATAVNRFADHHPGSICVDCLTAVYQAGALAAAEASTDEMARVRAEVVADERRRTLNEAADEVRRERQTVSDHQAVGFEPAGRLAILENLLRARARAAGSVPVATPQPWSPFQNRTDWLRDQHARYHDEPGNLLGRDDCSWRGCRFWDAAEWVLDAESVGPVATPTRPRRYDQCDGTCTVDCGHCKGQGQPAAIPTEPPPGFETRIQYGHQTDRFGWVPEYRGIKYARHQREVTFRNGPPLLLDHWSDPDGKRKPFDPQPAASPVPAEQPPTFEQLLSDPMEQFDTRSELLPAILHYLVLPDQPDAREALLRSIEKYRNAPPAAASTSHMTRPAEQPEER